MKNSWTGTETADTPSPSDGLLAVAVHRGEEHAFERLIERFERSLYQYADGILQDPFDAQEVVQDALMRALRALSSQYDEERCRQLQLRPWLFKTVRNLALNRRRSKRDKIERPMEAFDDNRLGPFVGSHSSEFEKQEEAEMLRAALSSLPVEARELIVLRFMEEMSYGEIARTVGSTEAALRGKVFRSLKLLRESLEQKGVAYAV